MHIELVDSLRCVRDHEETWLVATIERLEGRYIAEGVLGCPVCAARYPIRDFVADFRRDAAGARAVSHEHMLVNDETVLRAAAMFDLRAGGGPYVLGGTWGELALRLHAEYEAEALLINPPDDVHPGDGSSIVLADVRVPVAVASVLGTAIDVRAAADGLAPGCVAAVRAGGRVIAPSAMPVPDNVREIARDGVWWVAERSAEPTAPVRIARAP